MYEYVLILHIAGVPIRELHAKLSDARQVARLESIRQREYERRMRNDAENKDRQPPLSLFKWVHILPANSYKRYTYPSKLPKCEYRSIDSILGSLDYHATT